MHKLNDNLADTLDRNLEDRSQLLDEINYIVRDTTELPTKMIPRNRLFTSKFLLSLREEWFTRNKFPAGISISDIKYNHLGLKYQNICYQFNDQLDYVLAHYFAESKTTKGNINKFLSDPLMTLFTKKLFYKNANKWMEKLSELL